MIFWQIDVLKEQLRTRPFSARDMLPYLVAATLWTSTMFVFADWSRSWDRDWTEAGVDSLTTLLNGLISAFGLHRCYGANGGSTGRQFPERVCALGVVLWVRFLTSAALIFLFFVYAGGPFELAFEDIDLLSVVLVALFWIRLRHHIGTVAAIG